MIHVTKPANYWTYSLLVYGSRKRLACSIMEAGPVASAGATKKSKTLGFHLYRQIQNLLRRSGG